MSEHLAGHVVHVVSFGIQKQNLGLKIDPYAGQEGVFSTEEKAREYMRKLGKELYWTQMVGNEFDSDLDNDLDEDDEYPEPPSNHGAGRYYYEEGNIINFGTQAFNGEDDDRSGFVKYIKLHIDNVLHVPEETSNKKRKAS